MCGRVGRLGHNEVGSPMREKLDLLIRAGNPVVAVETRDEDGAVAIIRKLAEDTHRPLFEWSITSGLNRTVPKFADIGVKPGKPVTALEYVLEHTGTGKELYLFKDLAPHAKDATVARLLRDVYAREDVCAILVDSEPLPESIRRLCIPLPMPLPTTEELEAVIRDVYHKIANTSLAEIKVTLAKRDLTEMAGTLRGMTAAEAARVVASVIHDDNALTREDLPRLIEAKRNRLQSTGCLESITVNVTVDEIGGLGRLKQWLARRRGGMTPQARAFGIDPPRGILLLGVQGCGKSLCAKAVAADWTMPLLRLDPGVLYQKFVGESESRLREALAQAEAMAPVVLWVDEIEKAFASAAAESADGGLSQRIFGTLLSWMQDHHHPIFMVATANNISALPPELMRKGRFDEVFFVDLPDATARAAIWGVHLAKRKRDPKKFRLDELAKTAEGFSGAEIEQAVVSGLYAAFSGNRELTTEDLVAECATTRPLSVLMAEKITELREWAEGRCVPAD
jgi:SpoVK/Ycf46/Vps4 family AAA+-type ATPase